MKSDLSYKFPAIFWREDEFDAPTEIPQLKLKAELVVPLGLDTKESTSPLLLPTSSSLVDTSQKAKVMKKVLKEEADLDVLVKSVKFVPSGLPVHPSMLEPLQKDLNLLKDLEQMQQKMAQALAIPKHLLDSPPLPLKMEEGVFPTSDPKKPLVSVSLVGGDDEKMENPLVNKNPLIDEDEDD